MIGPLVRADRYRVAAMMVRAIDEDAAHASIAHFAERDFLFAAAGEGGHAPLKRVTIELPTRGTLDASKNVAGNDRQER
jgi:hypothetical protein